MLPRLTRFMVIGLLAANGCTGDIGGGPGQNGNNSDIPTPEEANEVGVSGARRLTQAEYDATVKELLGIELSDAGLLLPNDERTPFDNDYTLQTASQALIDGADLLAADLAAEVVADPALRQHVVPCEPSGAADEACFREFVTSFGRRALKRPLIAEEVDRFVVFMDHAAHEGDFWVAVDSALRAFLQHPEFLYRIEIGTPVPGQAGLFRLNDYEVATRLSFLLWGSSPPDFLLDEADAGTLSDPTTLAEMAATMFEDQRAKARVSRFHSLWMSYEELPHSADLASAMKIETDALLSRYLFEERRPWSEMLTSTETFLTPTLAEHYGLDAPSDADGEWMAYGDSGRAGLLSHGSFLSAVAKFEDTSPTQRGLLIRTRLFCQTINPPPADLMVNVDEPPGGPDPNACKSERYDMWKTDGCSMCHSLMEPVGFGLEQFDTAGRFRTYETDRPDCEIDGKGELEGVGEFQGPAELGELMIESGQVDACVAKQLYRYAMGRFELDEHDKALIERLVDDAAGDEDLRFDALLMEFVTSEAFRLRREEEIDG